MSGAKANIRLHAEARVRLERLFAPRAERQPTDCRGGLDEVAKIQSGMPRRESTGGDFFLHIGRHVNK